MASVPGKMISARDGTRPIPVIAMGTASESNAEGIGGVSVSPSTIIEAIKIGYRHFDTAAVYQTEKSLGEAISEALKSGLIKSRAELFITTKLWIDSTDGPLVLPAIKKSLRNLELDYVDLYLIHMPIKVTQTEFKLLYPYECIARMDMKATWEAMEECQNLGLSKSIGVSNFSTKMIKQILSFAKVPPVVNQVEMNPLWQQKNLTKICKENGILVTAYSPLGAIGNNAWGHNGVMECDVLQDIAKSKGKTVAQISLRWLYEQGVSIAVKSFNAERLKENLEIFYWSLSKEELSKIGQINQRRHVYLKNIFATNHYCDVVAEIDSELDGETERSK